MYLTVSSTFCGVQRLVEPASSPAPHLDGHHFCSDKRGCAVCAAAADVRLQEPWVAPPANAPATPSPALFRKSRRFSVRCPDSCSSLLLPGDSAGARFNPGGLGMRAIILHARVIFNPKPTRREE